MLSASSSIVKHGIRRAKGPSGLGKSALASLDSLICLKYFRSVVFFMGHYKKSRKCTCMITSLILKYIFENSGLHLKIFENQTLRKFPAIRMQ